VADSYAQEIASTIHFLILCFDAGDPSLLVDEKMNSKFDLCYRAALLT